MAKDTLRSAADAVGGFDQVLPGTVTGTTSKGYAEHACDGSSYDKFGNRLDIKKLATTQFK